MTMPDSGSVVVLNGAPRTGKSSIATVLVGLGWVSHGVDAVVDEAPAELRPSIGLRPGGERPDLEAHVMAAYRELFARVRSAASAGADVVVDVGLHDDYATGFDAWSAAHDALRDLDVLWVAVDCPMAEVLRRRAASTGYATAAADGSPPTPVVRWHQAVHLAHRYDALIDTQLCSALDAAAAVLRLLGREPLPEHPVAPGVSVAARWLGIALGLDPARRHHVSVVGAGGKSTTVVGLARYLHRGGSVVATTTTKMGSDQHQGWPVLTGPTAVDDVVALGHTGTPVVVWSLVEGDRALGVEPSVADALFNRAGSVVNEADGARRRSFKAPSAYEPVVADSTTLLLSVAGVDALGGVIGESSHRPDVVAELAGRSVDDVLDASAAAAVLIAADGQRRAVPAGASMVVLLSKVRPGEAGAMELARLIAAQVPVLGVLHHDAATLAV